MVILAQAKRARLAGWVAMVLAYAGAAAQTTNPAYVGLLPGVEQVKSTIRGTDPTDTLARQVAVFTYLSQMIEQIRVQRGYSAPLTADEQRAKGAYDVAAYQIPLDFAKSHTADETKAFNQLHGRYELDSQLYLAWYRTLPEPARAEFEAALHANAAHAKAHFDAEARQAGQPPASTPATPQGAGLNDPGAQSVRRCLELGGSDTACLARGMGTGLLDMVGLNSAALTGPATTGLVMNGNWKSRSTVSLNFGPGQVMLSGCGQLVNDNYPYTIARKGGVLQISIQNKPAAILLAMPSPQSLSGPGAVSVTGKIVVGTHHVYMQHYHNGVPDGTGYWQDEPIYGPKTERCTIGAFAAVQPAPASDSGDGGGLLGLLGGVMNEMMPGGAAPAALRMAGQYAGSSGLKLDFDAATVTLDCAQAHVKQNYTVQNSPGGLLVNVENGASPFNLTLAADGSLSGTGSTQVDGRLLIAMNDGGPQFAPTSARCAIVPLTLKH